MLGAVGNTDPVAARRLPVHAVELDLRPGRHAPRCRLRLMYNDGYGGTNVDCTTPPDAPSAGATGTILGNWTSTGSQTAMMGVGDTSGGGTREIFANQDNPADSLVDPLTPSPLPTPTTSDAARRGAGAACLFADTAAGTPVTIEGNYFGTRPRWSSPACPPPTSTSPGTASSPQTLRPTRRAPGPTRSSSLSPLPAARRA